MTCPGHFGQGLEDKLERDAKGLGPCGAIKDAEKFSRLSADSVWDYFGYVAITPRDMNIRHAIAMSGKGIAISVTNIWCIHGNKVVLCENPIQHLWLIFAIGLFVQAVHPMEKGIPTKMVKN